MSTPPSIVIIASIGNGMYMIPIMLDMISAVNVNTIPMLTLIARPTIAAVPTNSMLASTPIP